MTELLLVLALVAIVAAIAEPWTLRRSSRDAIHREVWAIALDVQYSRSLGLLDLADSRLREVEFAAGSSTYRWSHGARPLTAVRVAADRLIRFGALGDPSWGGDLPIVDLGGVPVAVISVQPTTGMVGWRLR